MGHTNYWRPAAVIGDAKWGALCEVTRRIIELAKARGVIVAGLDGEGEPTIGRDEILLNGSAHFEREGLGRQTAEDFCFPRAFRRRHDDLCKTYARPYDVVVVAVLLAARSLGVITWFSSDAYHRELCAGLSLAREAAPSWRIRLPRLRSRALDLGF